MKKVSVIIVAGGSGSRMGGSVPKQFLTLDGDACGAQAAEWSILLPVSHGGEADSPSAQTEPSALTDAGSGALKVRGQAVDGEDALQRCDDPNRKDSRKAPQSAQTANPCRTPAECGAFTEREQAANGSRPSRESAVPDINTPDTKETRRIRDASLDNAPILEITLRGFMAALPGCEIVVVLPEGEIPRWKRICAARGLEGTHRICSGGKTRFDSVRNGIQMLGECDYIAVHDGVRPLVTSESILRCVASAERHGSGIPAIRPVDSFRIAEGGTSRIIDRNLLRAVQTPQVFRSDMLVGAYDTGYDPRFTDDASVVEAAGVSVTLCEGDRENIKITTREDLAIAKAILRQRAKNCEGDGSKAPET